MIITINCAIIPSMQTAEAAISPYSPMGTLFRSLWSNIVKRSFSSPSNYSNYRKPLAFSRASGFRRSFSSTTAAASSPSTADAPGGALDPSRLRNVALIGHVDHGKTTLMHWLRRHCGADIPHERALDSIRLEDERVINIDYKVTSVLWKGNVLNMVDTPGHADFGEVEQVMAMVDGAILVVDPCESPLAHIKFVLAKALNYGLCPLLLLNKVDTPSVTKERCNEVKRLVFDLFGNLGAAEEQLEIPVLYASAKEGWVSSMYTKSPSDEAKSVSELLDAIIRHVPPPTVSLNAPFQMLLSLVPSASSQRSLGESIQAAVEAKTYQEIPELLNALKGSCRKPNPFSFLSTFSESHRVHVVDEILQSFIPSRPRSRPCVAYSCLLSYILESPNPLPLALAILQRMLRSGCLPDPQTNVLLSSVWLNRRRSHGASSILLEMHSIGYYPDCGTCNYLILSLCKVNQYEEAVKVLREMGRASCVPDLDSYGTLINEMTEVGMTNEVAETVKEMVRRHGLNPRKEIIVKVVNAMRANGGIWRAVDMIEFLESEDVHIGFEAYELSLEGCLEGHQFLLAGKFAIRMTERGFIPYVRVRQRVVEGLVSIGESELASIVRQRFAELKS